MLATAGLPFLVRPAIAAAVSPDGEPVANAIVEAARFALIERLRRVDEPVLDTLLVSSLSPGPRVPTTSPRRYACDSDEAQRLVDRARASGLIEPSHSQAFLRSVHLAVAADHRRRTASRHRNRAAVVADSNVDAVNGSRVAAGRARAARRSAGRRARRPGRPSAAANRPRRHGCTARPPKRARPNVDARLADALALTGDCATAGRLADELLASDDAAERAAAVRIAASIAVHDGSAAQAADLFRWLGPYPDAFVSAAGAVVSARRR